ncbi:hypothetical protein MNBD_GAMMA20-412 [hydrothermal vent metagenome]|uniref:Uncharacterized protein n=1 Tax=hydrothermal vent metagenome TaxID=652676 RepID=A0A3B1A6N7_9ZZZZ
MIFFIKEWPNRTATLMADNGAVLWTFHSVAEARRVCEAWYKARDEPVDYQLYTLQDPGQDALQDPSCATYAIG